MFQTLVERLLGKILGQYIQNFSKQNLSIGVWSGQVILKNIALKKQIIKKINLPLHIKFSRLGLLKLNIPWKSLTSSKIQVLLQGLEVVVAELPQSKWQCKDTKIIEKRKQQIQDYCESVVNDFAKKAQKAKEGDQGYFSKLVVKIIDNLQVTVKDIHIRYEDEITKEYSFGVTLEELKVYTVNKQGKPEYIDRAKPEYAKEPLRKRLELYNIGVYWNQKSQFYNQSNYSQKLHCSIAKRGQHKFQHNYIILMTSQAKLQQRDPGKQFSEPEIDLGINLQTLKLEITNNQLQQIITLGQRLQKYSLEVKKHNTRQISFEEKKKYKQQFRLIFPEYFKEWGKELCQQKMKQLQSILEIMEVQNFTKDMTQYLQDKQMKRLIEQKKQKNRGWFSKPKDLTTDEMKQIQKYLDNNFGQEVSLVKRPKDYYHIQISFRLQKLEIIIANTLSIIREGIKTELDELNINFQLREGGYKLFLGLQDISINMFKQAGLDPMSYTAILYKIVPFDSQFSSKQYIQLQVLGNPLDKPHLNTDIKMTTSELMIVFYPKIIEVAVNFADLRLSKQNKEAAIEKYGQIKEATTTAVSQTIQQPVKQLIGADIFLNSVTIAVPFNPKKPDQCCWGLSLGSVRFSTDDNTLKRKSISENQPIDVYNLELKAFSFRQYTNISQLQNFRLKALKTIDPRQSVINNLDFKISLQLYNKNTIETPKIKVNALLPDFSVTLNEFLYKSLLKMGDCFQMEQSSKGDRMSQRITQKTEIKSKASKIGMVYVKDGMTQLWKKYVAIMSQNYIYLYLGTKDENYYAYYYIKGATLQKIHETSDKEKPYHFRIKNNLNEVTFGFDKPELIDDWLVKIKKVAKKRQEEEASATVVVLEQSIKPQSKTNHNILNVLVNASIEKINIKAFTTDSLEQNVVGFEIGGISSEIFLHESKKIINLQLGYLELTDNFKTYKKADLKYFLRTQHTQQNQNLIKIHILQLDKLHPQYCNVLSNIDVNFGKLTCNYKCETVKALMSFFIPKKQNEEIPQMIPQDRQSLQASLSDSILSFALVEQIFSIKLNMQISQVSVNLINQKTNILISKLGIHNFKLYNAASNRRMILIGSLGQLFMVDYSRYPNTIIEELQNYEQYSRHIMKANFEQQQSIKNMVEFDIKMLNQVNQNNKKMLIKTQINNLTIFYTQQPILRLITYLNTQMLPSFDTGSPQKKAAQQAIKQTKPEPTPMDLQCDLFNISVFVQPNPLDLSQQQFLHLNIEQIIVRNKAEYRAYASSDAKNVLVQNYNIIIKGMGMYIRYFGKKGKKHEYQLSNKMTITSSIDLIANPRYYMKQMKNSFKNGLRMECSMTAFLMRINQKDYAFMMKCLNWAISHDDGVDNILYDMPQPKNIDPSTNIQQKDPFFLNLTIDCLSLLIMKKQVPRAFLVLDDMKYSMTIKEQMSMQLKLFNIYGTSIKRNKQYQILTERGMFNAIGYTKQHPFKEKVGIEELLKMFRRQKQAKQIQKVTPFLDFGMTTSQNVSIMSITMTELILDVDIKTLMTLSMIANVDEKDIKGPKPIIQKQELTIQKVHIQSEQSMMMEQSPRRTVTESQINGKRSSMSVNLHKILASVSDKKKQKVIMFQTEVSFQMVNFGDKTVQQLQQYWRKPHQRLHHSSMNVLLKNMSLYFCKIKNGQLYSKRQILKPFQIGAKLESHYHYLSEQNFFVHSTDIEAKTHEIWFFASMVDLLNMDIIMKDNLKALEEAEKSNQKKKKTKVEKNQEELVKIEKQAVKAVQKKMKLRGQIQPIQFQLVNDFNNNFMPVLRLLIQDINPLVDQFLVKNHTMVSSLFSLYFFNPRSSQWQPIIEPFKSTIDYLVLTTPDGPVNKFLVQSHKIKQDQNQVGSLKLNISTQMVETLLAAKDIAMKQKQKLQNQVMTVFDFIMNAGQQKQDEEDVEVSPFIFENITNQNIHLARGDKEFQLQSLFKGPVKLLNDQEITFRLKNQLYTFGMDHYGTLKIGNSSFFIQFDIQKLSRVIRFLSPNMIQNKLFQAIYVKRKGYYTQGAPKKFQIGDYIPLDNILSFSISMSGNSWTYEYDIKRKDYTSTLNEQKKNKFTILFIRNKSITKYNVYQLHPPFIINNCLPKGIELQFIVKASTKHTKTIMSQYTHQVCASQDVQKLQFRLNIQGYGWSKLFKYSQRKDGQENTIVMDDQDAAKTHINFTFSKLKQFPQYILSIYCKKLVLNQLADKLIVYGNSAAQQAKQLRDRYKLLGGQKRHDKKFDDKIILIGQQVGNKIRICGMNCQFDFATPIPVGGIGQSSARIVVDRQINGKIESVFTIISVEISLMKMSPHCDVFSKKIVLRSKGIISNSTKYNFVLKQEHTEKMETQLPAGSRLHSVFGMPDIKGKAVNGYYIQCQGFQRSNLIKMPQQGSFYFKLKRFKEDEIQILYFKINVQHVQGYIFHQITQIQQKQLPYQIITKSKNLVLAVGTPFNKNVKYGQSHRFLNQDVHSPIFKPSLIISPKDRYGFIWTSAIPDDLNFRRKQKLRIGLGPWSYYVIVQIYVTFNDKTKTIVIDQIHDEQQQKEKQVSYMLMNLPEIVISINQNSHRITKPYESLVLTFQRLIFIKEETDKKTNYQLKLGFMQIDQAYPHKISNPVVLTPYKYQEFTKQEEPQSIFNSMIVINNSFKENTFIDQISVDFNDIVTKFSLDFLNLVTELSKEYAQIMKYEEKSYYINKDIQKWKEVDIPQEGRKTFIKNIQISPFTIDLSAELNLKKLGGINSQLLFTFISTIGVVVSNIQDAPIKLSGMKIANCIDTSEGITQKIISRYKGDVVTQIYKVLGSLNIIGNPMGLLRNISTGFQDLATKPAKGFVHGPAEFGKGILEGTGSLVAHSVGGAFNSLSKITGTVSTGLATLAFDDEFEQHRQKQKMKKPKNILQGLQKGGKAILYGFKQGITGVFTQPYQNAKKEGVLGFMKGAAKGVAGLVVKPVTGVIDFASKTTEGIKNNALMFEDKANENRMRYPRVFYTQCHILKQYNKLDGLLQYSLMKTANDQKFDNCIFIDSFLTGDGTQFLTILEEYIVLIDITKRKVRWQMPIDQFDMRNIANKKLLYFKSTKKTTFFSSDQHEVIIEEDEEREDVMDLINRIIKEKMENK